MSVHSNIFGSKCFINVTKVIFIPGPDSSLVCSITLYGIKNGVVNESLVDTLLADFLQYLKAKFGQHLIDILSNYKISFKDHHLDINGMSVISFHMNPI